MLAAPALLCGRMRLPWVATGIAGVGGPHPRPLSRRERGRTLALTRCFGGLPGWCVGGGGGVAEPTFVMADGSGVSGDDVVAGGDESDDATADTACCDAGGIGLASVIGLVSGEEVGQGMGKSEGFEVGAAELFEEDVVVQDDFEAETGIVRQFREHGDGGDAMGTGAPQVVGGAGVVIFADGVAGALEGLMAGGLVVADGSD